MINLKPVQTNSYRPGRKSVSVLNWPEIAYFAKLISNIFQLVDGGHDPRHGIWNDPVYVVCQHIILSELTQRQKTTKLKTTPIDTEYEYGSLNFISLLNSVVDENWVCRHHLLQFILEKCCCIRCSDLFKHFVNSKFTKRFHFFGAQIDLFIIFVCSFYRQ